MQQLSNMIILLVGLLFAFLKGEQTQVQSRQVPSFECGDRFNGTSGIFSSPQRSGTYPPYSNCTWVIEVGYEYRVQIWMEAFDVEYSPNCVNDYVEVQVDNCEETNTTHSRFCGEYMPVQTSSTNRLIMIFRTDDQTQGKGFFGNWTAIKSDDVPMLLSAGKPTNQSSTLSFFQSDLAVDGIEYTYNATDSCSQTSYTEEPWWIVDLQKAVGIQYVDIVRNPSRNFSLAETEVRIGMSPDFYQNPICKSLQDDNVSSFRWRIRVECGYPLIGRFVSVQTLDTIAHLQLCEVMVYGYAWYSGLSKQTKNKLQVAQNKIVRFIKNLPPRSHIGRDQLSSIGYLNIKNRVKFLRLSHVHKIANGYKATYLSEHFMRLKDLNHKNKQFQCFNGRCVPPEYICNGYDNCGDGSDEQQLCDPLVLSDQVHTEQSSTYIDSGNYGYLSRFAIDGDARSYMKSCTHSRMEFQPWWMLDLGNTYDIRYVDIVNRKRFEHRLNGAEVGIGMSRKPGVNPRCGSVIDDEMTSMGYELRIDCVRFMHGRFVTVQLTGISEYLTLCEVILFGYEYPRNGKDVVCSYSPGPCDVEANDCLAMSSTSSSCKYPRNGKDVVCSYSPGPCDVEANDCLAMSSTTSSC
ncbi:uncharacterized protein LOC117100553, partial [Anneissia japonica]|uniref:uncharacterized protein LOC117100553 n=1 Tax=Anneissia japonica TaxID=1529436 RepID=UPI001425B6D3